MVALAESESDGEAGVDADGCAGADVEVATAEAACDGGRLLVCELAGALCWAEGGGGGAGEGGGVVVVLVLLESGVDGGRGEVDWILLLGCVGVGIRTGRAEAALQAALARQHLAAPRLAGVTRHTRPPDRRPLGCSRQPASPSTVLTHLCARPPQAQPPSRGPAPAAAAAASPTTPLRLAPLRLQGAPTFLRTGG